MINILNNFWMRFHIILNVVFIIIVIQTVIARVLAHYEGITDVSKYFPATLELIIFASLIMVCVGVPLGILAGRFKDKPIDVKARVAFMNFLLYFGNKFHLVCFPFIILIS